MPEKSQRTLRIWIIGSLITIFLILVGTLPLFSFLRRPFEELTSPILSGLYKITGKISQFTEPWGDRKQMTEELFALREENKSLLQKVSVFETLQEQQKIQDQIESFLRQFNLSGVHARVIGKNSSSKHVLIINKGEIDGVKAGLPVISSEGIFVGTIDTVNTATSIVTLITDPSQNIGGKIQNEKSSPGVIHGSFGLSMTMTLIPQDDIVSIGQTVVTSSINPVIPPNILLGTITRVNEHQGTVFQDAQLSSPLQFERLEVVSVILPSNES